MEHNSSIRRSNLVIERKYGESIQFYTNQGIIEITPQKKSGTRVRIFCRVPDSIKVLRQECELLPKKDDPLTKQCVVNKPDNLDVYVKDHTENEE